MKKLFAIIICLTITSPCWAETVYTNSSLKKYDAYKGDSTIKSYVPNRKQLALSTTSAQEGSIKIKNHDYRWTDTSGNFYDYSWQVKIRNTYNKNKRLYIEFSFLDRKGFTLDKTNEIVVIRAHKTETFRGTGMIRSGLASQAKKTLVKIREM